MCEVASLHGCMTFQMQIFCGQGQFIERWESQSNVKFEWAKKLVDYQVNILLKAGLTSKLDEVF